MYSIIAGRTSAAAATDLWDDSLAGAAARKQQYQRHQEGHGCSACPPKCHDHSAPEGAGDGLAIQECSVNALDLCITHGQRQTRLLSCQMPISTCSVGPGPHKCQGCLQACDKRLPKFQHALTCFVQSTLSQIITPDMTKLMQAASTIQGDTHSGPACCPLGEAPRA